jgi:transmembrane sensor
LLFGQGIPPHFVYYHHNMENQFKKYLNGTCNPKEFSEVIASVGSSENNVKVESDILEHWKETLRQEVENRENDPLLDKIHHSIALEESKVTGRKINLYRNLLKIAAVLVTGLLISAIVFYNQAKKEPVAALFQKITTPFGARSSFKLPDGSEVWLNSGSTISFPQQYGEVRNVELTGQAYFKVVKDGKPFIVKTGYGTIEVTGTSFDAKAYSNEDFRTTLVEGSVKVSNNMNQVAILKPGQQSRITPANEFSFYEVNTSLTTSWREGKLIFEKEPFQNVARELERWYNVKIELQGERLKKLGYTGTIEMETFSEVLELINTTTPIRYIFDKKTRILKISGS